MTAPTRSRSKNRSTVRRPVSRTSGRPTPRVVILGTVAVITLLIGAVLGYTTFRAAPRSVGITSAPAGSPAIDVALPSEGNPGPVRMQGLVPSGFTTGPTGANAAASAYAQALVNFAASTDAQAQVGANTMLASSARKASITDAVTAVKALTSTSSDATVRVIPLGSRLMQGTATRQTIAVWVTALTASPSGIPVNGSVINAPTEAVFMTLSVTVERTTTDWKFVAATVTSGPTPALASNAPITAEAFAKELQSFKGYAYLPPAQESK